MSKDNSSLSNPDEAKSEHLHLILNVDFDKTIISGSVEFTVVANKGAKSFIVDTKELTISGVRVDGKDSVYDLAPKHEIFGRSLSIPLPPAVSSAGGKCSVMVNFSTSTASSACQWLPPAQTAGKRYPFLFTQCQAIHARSLFPCQDCPKAKCTWSSEVTAPAWATVLMSALEQGSPAPAGGGARLCKWKQPVPTCSYLVALAVGDLSSRDISPRCKVWSEPALLEAVAYEFAETEEFLSVGEGLTCPYLWTRYDILCLPPSFPYGGMENPCLTFVTPTLLAGDRSLAGVVAHEISHSWTGNLVTNETWEHFWLNEGWTMWLERRILARCRAAKALASGATKAIADSDGARYFDFLAAGGWKALEEAVAHYDELKQPELSALVPKLEGVDPDDAFSSVPYEKGFALLYTLQKLVGDEPFEKFVKEYISEFKLKTVNSAQFRDFAIARLGADKLKGVDWDAWFNRPGLPARPTLDTTLARMSEDLAAAWRSVGTGGVAEGGVPPAIAKSKGAWGAWTSLQQQTFLDALVDVKGFSVGAVEEMERTYRLSATRNSEVRFRWLLLALRSGAGWAVDQALAMATSQGRMKFTRPLFREVYKAAIPGARAKAVQAFLDNLSFYHPICRAMVSKDLQITDAQVAAATCQPAAAGRGGGLLGLSWGAWGGAAVAAYLAFAVWRVRNNRCPIPFI